MTVSKEAAEMNLVNLTEANIRRILPIIDAALTKAIAGDKTDITFAEINLTSDLSFSLYQNTISKIKELYRDAGWEVTEVDTEGGHALSFQ